MGLRSKISGSDFAATAHAGYLKDGFGIAAPREPERLIPVPEWMRYGSKIADFIRKQFPLAGKFGEHCGCECCSERSNILRSICNCRWCKQTMLAGRWTTVIVRYFCGHEPDMKIEEESHWKPGTVGSIAQKIRRIDAGQRQDGLPRTGKPRGRPKKIIPDNHTEVPPEPVVLNLQ